MGGTPRPRGANWGAPPSLAWASDNPKAAHAIWELCEGEPYHATLIDADAREAFIARGRPDPPPAVGAVICVLQDGRTYVVASDDADEDCVRYVGTYAGAMSRLAGNETHS